MDTLGIDISKRDFHAALLHDDHIIAKKSFPNSDRGFAQLDAWLRNRQAGKISACMEATGAYYSALATHLFRAGHDVAVVNPKRIKAFAESELLRTKTDAVDAALIARFAATQPLVPWKPLPPEILELQGLARHLEFLKRSRVQHTLRSQTPGLPASVLRSTKKIIKEFDAQIAALKRQIKDHINRHPGLKAQSDLLDSIPGIGLTTAAGILAEAPNITEFRSGQAVAAYAGLSPHLHQSGTSVHRKTRLSKIGNARLRKVMYMPAVVAKKHNPTIKALSQRLAANGKVPMVIIGAIMRKLLVIAYGVLKSGKPYDPAFGLQIA